MRIQKGYAIDKTVMVLVNSEVFAVRHDDGRIDMLNSEISAKCRALAEKIVDEILVGAYGDGSAEFHVGRNAPDTSKAVSDKIKSGSLQGLMLERFMFRAQYVGIDGAGMTDDELEVFFGRTHQSVSACRNTLMRKGYLVDSGKRRKTRSGNQAIVWEWTGKQP